MDLLESCTNDEVCEALDGNAQLLEDLKDRLREWLLLQPHLPKDISVRRLEYFIISTKLCLEEAKEKLDSYYTVRRQIPELFTNRIPSSSNIKRYGEIFQWVCLPKLTERKYRVSILRLIADDPSKFQPWDFFKYTFMIGEIRMEECRSLGDIYVYDLKNMKFSHLVKMNPIMLKKCEVAATRAYGARIKGIHFINAPSFIDRMMSIVKSIIKPKLAERIHVHSSSCQSLHEFLPKSILPREYEGEEVPMDELNEKWQDKLLEWKEWFKLEDSVVVNEALRPNRHGCKNDNLSGFHGSFRKLEID